MYEQGGFSQRYKKLSSFNENLHYVFVEYQGSNITHWNFADPAVDATDTPARRLSSDIFLLADKDIDAKGSRVADLESALGANFHLLEWKEIENYIPKNVIVETANERWDTFKGVGDSKFDPSPVSDDTFKSDTVGIGKTLEEYVKRSGNVKTERKFFEDKSGTIKNKVIFCETACKLMKNAETEWHLTPELEDLCDKIWLFIENNNKI